MKNYELVIIFHPDLEMNIDPAIDKIKQILKANHANITREETDGKRRLAYPIKKQEFGIYYYYDLELPPEAPAKISGSFNIADEIIRYQLVKADPRKVKMLAKQSERAARTGQSADSNDTTSSTTNQEEK